MHTTTASCVWDTAKRGVAGIFAVRLVFYGSTTLPSVESFVVIFVVVTTSVLIEHTKHKRDRLSVHSWVCGKPPRL